MSITIPDELAERVLEALSTAADDAEYALTQLSTTCYVQSRLDRARRERDSYVTARDELAALLTPKEAT